MLNAYYVSDITVEAQRLEIQSVSLTKQL
jgi:hypothetical protein